MKEVFKPIGLGVAAYVVSAIGIWLIASFLLLPFMPNAMWFLPPLVIFTPLFVSGYVGAKFTLSRFRSRRITFGVVAGLAGYCISLLVTQMQGEVWVFAILSVGASVVAALGGLFGSRSKYAL